jgi:hypothetical protein
LNGRSKACSALSRVLNFGPDHATLAIPDLDPHHVRTEGQVVDLAAERFVVVELRLGQLGARELGARLGKDDVRGQLLGVVQGVPVERVADGPREDHVDHDHREQRQQRETMQEGESCHERALRAPRGFVPDVHAARFRPGGECATRSATCAGGVKRRAGAHAAHPPLVSDREAR